MDLRVIVRSVLAAAVLYAACAGGAAAANLARCVGAYGEPMFTQQCPGLPAAARPRDAGLQAAPPTAPRTAARSPAAAFCARSPQALAAQVQAAIHARNGVRLSGYALWRGRSSGGVRGDVRGLLQVIRSGFADVQLLQRPGVPDLPQDDAAAFAAGRRPAAASDHEYALVITSLDQRRDALRSNERSFGVTRDHGCYWLTLAPAAWLADAPHSAAAGAEGGGTALAWDSR
ncbi:hypothetical protein [Tahibacter harae]|uniref:Uncharacterized protein n=1 Tax=Tahibacter harae TaxID=2963937 RepID=A0ABT1QTC3_9GAMM|nr:hypothetical protein [Tahibacter harae]MCQ4165524.1 hypothetical protein [Tahibacter harae]